MAKKPMTQEEKDFFSRFEVSHDHLTVQIQLQEIQEKVFEGLKKDFGKIIKRQPKHELVRRYLQVIDTLY